MEERTIKESTTYFEGWEITKKLGSGSYGRVYEIERKELGRVYTGALKVISIPRSEEEYSDTVHEFGEEGAQKYYLNIIRIVSEEIAIMARLSGHTNIVNYFDHKVLEHENKRGWDIMIRMELLTPLRNYINQEKHISRRQVIQLGIDICAALEECRKHSIVHRDIKPDNIMISESGHFKLGDFGVSRVLENGRTIDMTRTGTEEYMAPELYLMQNNCDSRVDIYSLGIVLYQLLNANRMPFCSSYPNCYTQIERENALKMRMSGKYPLVNPLNTSNDILGEIVLKACAYDKDKRFSTPTEMRKDLESINLSDEDMKILREEEKWYELTLDEKHAQTTTISPLPNKNHKLGFIIAACILIAVLAVITTKKFPLANGEGESESTNPTETAFLPATDLSTPPAMSPIEAEAIQELSIFFGDKFGWDNKKANPEYSSCPNKYNVYLADITHDGIDEMIVLDDTNDQEGIVELSVYSYNDGEISNIYFNSSTKMPRDKLFGLYDKDGLIFLVVYINDMWMTGGKESYEVFSLSKTGNQETLLSDIYSQTIDPDRFEELGSGYYEFVDRKEEILKDTIVIFNCSEPYVRQSDPNIVLAEASAKKRAAPEPNASATSTQAAIDRSGIVAAGTDFTVLLKGDGTVLTIGSNEVDTSEWHDIVQVAADGFFAIGLKSDGTLVASGDLRHGEGDVSSWRDVVQVACGYRHTIAVTKEGTVYYAGVDSYSRSQCRNWTNVKKVLAGGEHVAAIFIDGTVLAAGKPDDERLETGSFTSVIDGDIGSGSTFCILDDRTVLETGYNYAGEDKVGEWTDIIAIASEYEHTIGLRGDGTVIAIGSNMFGMLNTSGWTDVIAIAAGQYHTVGVRSDGTILAVGSNQYGQIDVDDVKLW